MKNKLVYQIFCGIYVGWQVYYTNWMISTTKIKNDFFLKNDISGK